MKPKSERLTEVQRELEQPDVWNEPERAQALGQERSQPRTGRRSVSMS